MREALEGGRPRPPPAGRPRPAASGASDRLRRLPPRGVTWPRGATRDRDVVPRRRAGTPGACGRGRPPSERLRVRGGVGANAAGDALSRNVMQPKAQPRHARSVGGRTSPPATRRASRPAASGASDGCAAVLAKGRRSVRKSRCRPTLAHARRRAGTPGACGRGRPPSGALSRSMILRPQRNQTRITATTPQSDRDTTRRTASRTVPPRQGC
jgi:hypothetical protein